MRELVLRRSRESVGSPIPGEIESSLKIRVQSDCGGIVVLLCESVGLGSCLVFWQKFRCFPGLQFRYRFNEPLLVRIRCRKRDCSDLLPSRIIVGECPFTTRISRRRRFPFADCPKVFARNSGRLAKEDVGIPRRIQPLLCEVHDFLQSNNEGNLRESQAILWLILAILLDKSWFLWHSSAMDSRTSNRFDIKALVERREFWFL